MDAIILGLGLILVDQVIRLLEQCTVFDVGLIKDQHWHEEQAHQHEVDDYEDNRLDAKSTNRHNPAEEAAQESGNCGQRRHEHSFNAFLVGVGNSEPHLALQLPHQL